MATIIDGKKVSSEVREDIKNEVNILRNKGFRAPGLAVILVGDVAASNIYVNMKEKACIQAGFYSVVERLDQNITETELLDIVDKYNRDNSIDGILVQLPLPEHIREAEVVYKISPDKDVDGFHPYNVGLSLIGEDTFCPCTPLGIMYLLDSYGIDLKGMHAVIVGRSNIVGKPMFTLLLRRHATVTVCHSRTVNIGDIIKTADIIIAALGRPGFIKRDWIKKGAVVIDVGINRLPDNSSSSSASKLVGDVDYDAVFDIASYITPVPGGVGPMTIAMLMKNTLKSFKQRFKIK